MLYDAVCGNLRGEEAAIEVIGWENAEIRFKEIPKKKISRRIEAELMSLIMEAMRRKDELSILEDEELIQLDDTMDVLPEDLDLKPFQQPLSSESMDTEDMDQENQQPTKDGKETTMNVQKLNKSIEILKEDLGDALLATDIFGSADGQGIAGYNPQPKASALFSQVTAFMVKSLDNSGFAKLGKYYLLDLAGNKVVICIILGDYQWGMLVDTNKAQLGLLLNVVMPKVIDAFEDAITG
jgi:hypothetical protein